jgi:diguanylate cyclase (GGDEF)-like protein/PAS domain S-box-containing protein
MAESDSAGVSLSLLLKNVPGMAYRCIADDSRTMLFVSEGALRLTGYEASVLMNAGDVSYAGLIHPEDRDRVEDEVSEAVAANVPFQISYRIRTADGSQRWVSENGQRVGIEGRSAIIEGYVTDISRFKDAEAILQETANHLRERSHLLDHASDAIMIWCDRFLLRYWNAGAERLYGWAAEDVLGKRAGDVLYENAEDLEHAAEELARVGRWRGEVRHKRKDGSILVVDSRLTAAPARSGDETRILSINTDISRRKEAEETIQKMVFYDALTGLPNRAFILERLHHVISIGARTHAYAGLMFIDLDNFKALNDTMGHDNGDKLLQMVARRMAGTLRESDTVARLSGDEFIVLLEDLSQDENQAAHHAKEASQKLLDTFVAPFNLDGLEHFSSCSIGVTLFRGHSASMDQILKQADMAMYEAKNSGRNSMRFFQPEMQKAITLRAALEQDLRQSLVDRSFVVYYQAQINSSGAVTGAEALVRWVHQRRGLVMPSEFIPVCEETGLIQQIGMFVLETACRQLRVWQDSSETRDLTMSVNVSARQFRHPEFVNRVASIIRETGIAPGALKLELTESCVAGDICSTVSTMMKLQKEGVSFSLDDFGTGYSSLSYLKQLPLDQLKIDQSFVSDVTTNVDDSAIARTIVGLGQSLGLAVIAEGVETSAQEEFLRAHGCGAYQGFLFAPPVPIDQFRYSVAPGR